MAHIIWHDRRLYGNTNKIRIIAHLYNTVASLYGHWGRVLKHRTPASKYDGQRYIFFIISQNCTLLKPRWDSGHTSGFMMDFQKHTLFWCQSPTSVLLPVSRTQKRNRDLRSLENVQPWCNKMDVFSDWDFQN
jgi:hypothetical protein